MPPDLTPQWSGLLALPQAATVHFIKAPKPILSPFKWAVNGRRRQKEAAESRRRQDANDHVGPGAPSHCSGCGPAPSEVWGVPVGRLS